MSVVDYELCHPYLIHHAETLVTWLFMITCRGQNFLSTLSPSFILCYLFFVSYLRYLEMHYYIIVKNHILFYDVIKTDYNMSGGLILYDLISSRSRHIQGSKWDCPCPVDEFVFSLSTFGPNTVFVLQSVTNFSVRCPDEHWILYRARMVRTSTSFGGPIEIIILIDTPVTHFVISFPR